MKLSQKKYNLKAKTIDILKGVKIKTPEETLDKLINENCSISRLGDGEFDLIWGIGIQYQNVNDKLVKKLREILESNEDKLLIGINNAFDLDYINKYNDFAKNYWKGWLKDNKYRVLKLLSKKKQYYSALISRFYIDYEDKSSVSEYVEKLKKLWDKKDVLVVEGEFSRLGVGNDLFNNMNSIQRIICPSENAFDEYDEIFEKILEYGKNKLILLALGPTATVLAYDLYKVGYRAIDIGHVDIEYEWFYWELPFNITYIKENNENLYLGNENGDIYILDGITDNGINIKSKWTTPMDSFGYEAYRKTTNKSGAILEVEPKGSNIKVEVKKDIEEPIEIGSFSDEKGYIVLKIKQKKWRELQMIFSSNTPFSIIKATIEVLIGGYIKR